ncbi:MAG: hypothetical protein M1829_005620 [Trizodia sp. TS-e1964]|nr:MAG: hypothetical protein M1829_005620 [Trizodia sp. TS-e1964]
MDFNRMKVVELKAELKRRGLPQSGLKQALIDRLTEDESNTMPPVEDDHAEAPRPPDQRLSIYNILEEEPEAEAVIRNLPSLDECLPESILRRDGQYQIPFLPTFVAPHPVTPVFVGTPVHQHAPVADAAVEITVQAPHPLSNQFSNAVPARAAITPPPPPQAQQSSPTTRPSLADLMEPSNPLPVEPLSSTEINEDLRKRKRSQSLDVAESEVAQKRLKQYDADAVGSPTGEDLPKSLPLPQEMDIDNMDSEITSVPQHKMAVTEHAQESPELGPERNKQPDLEPAETAVTDPDIDSMGKSETKCASPKISPSEPIAIDDPIEKSQAETTEPSLPPQSSSASVGHTEGTDVDTEMHAAPLEEKPAARRPSQRDVVDKISSSSPKTQDKAESQDLGQVSASGPSPKPSPVLGKNEVSEGKYPLEMSVSNKIDHHDHPATPPSLHPATPALYIRNLMRPLNPSSLKEHLIFLATPTNTAPAADTMVDFYLDPIRTHGFAVFSTVLAATRVRSALHDQVWPMERTRKPLWVDFVPQEKVQGWIEIESNNAGSSSNRHSKRWEVVYIPGNEGSSNELEVILREVGSSDTMQLPGERGSIQGIPTGPRRVLDEGAGPNVKALTTLSRDAPRSVNLGFVALDQLFKSTAAKPKLYYQAVSKDIADRRLSQLAVDNSGVTYRGRGHGESSGRGELRLFTFEDGDRLVDRGPDTPEHDNRRRGENSWRPAGRVGQSSRRGPNAWHGGRDRHTNDRY